MPTYGELPVPGTSSVAEVTQDEILFSTVGLVQKGGTIAAGQNLDYGQVIARLTASGKYVALGPTTATDGSQTAVGILRRAVDATNGDQLGNIVLAGSIKADKIVGATTGLNGRLVELGAQDVFIF